MAGLEANLRIGAKDETGPALKAIQAKMEAISKIAESVDKAMSSIGGTAKAIDPVLASLDKMESTMRAAYEVSQQYKAGLESLSGPAREAARSQGLLEERVRAATKAINLQGETAGRVSQRISNTRQGGGYPLPIGGGHAGGHRGALGAAGEMLPFAGPEVLAETKKAYEAGATTQEQIARLQAGGAKPEDIAQARRDFVEFSKTHAGVLESDYLGGYSDARVIAPGEAFEMAKHGAVYRAALRNSGLSVSEHDVGDAMRIMDEINLSTDDQRKDFINQLLKTQQTFRDQVPVGTILSAVRNAKQSVYGLSPEFINKYLPTLLQASGQNGGTELMTAYSNYLGQHMSHMELVALANAGFANKKDMIYDKNGKIKQLREGAQFFREDLFKSDPASWSWAMHDEYMSRKGSTEAGFDKLLAKFPRNMSAMISFFTHGENRVKRDAETRDHAIGDAAASNDALGRNPVAGLSALTTSIESFAAAITGPSMAKVGETLASTASGIQKIAAAYSDWASKHPEAAKQLGIEGMGAGAAAGGWLSWQLLSGVGRLLGLSSGAGGAAGAGAGLLGPGALVAGGWLAGMQLLGPDGPLAGYYRPQTDADFPDHAMLERSRRARLVWHGSSWVDDPEAARGRAYAALASRSDGGGGVQQVNVAGQAQLMVKVEVTASSELLKIIQANQEFARLMALNPVQGGHSGRMDSDAAPSGFGGVGRHL